MKILQLIQKPQLRGAEVFTSQLSSHLNMLGHEAVVVSIFPGNAELPFNGKKINLGGKSKFRMFDIKAWRRLSEIIKTEKPSIIQANAGDTLKYAVFSKLFFRWKQPIAFRNASTISLYIKSKPAVIWNSFFFQYVSKIISVSKVSAQDFARLFPQYLKRIVTVPIGIEATSENFFEKGASSNGSSLLHEGSVLLHVGGFTHEKNHKGLISIFAKILSIKPDCSLHMIGDGILRKEIEDLVKEKNLGNKVCFHGQKPALKYIHNADVLLLPSVIEGLPGVILEAFYCKTPVVAYNVGGIKELVYNNETGYLVDKNNEAAFAEATVAALNKNDANKRLIENANQLVRSRYLNTQVAKEFVNVYQSILA